MFAQAARRHEIDWYLRILSAVTRLFRKRGRDDQIFGAPVTEIAASTRGFKATRGGAIETSALIK